MKCLPFFQGHLSSWIRIQIPDPQIPLNSNQNHWYKHQDFICPLFVSGDNILCYLKRYFECFLFSKIIWNEIPRFLFCKTEFWVYFSDSKWLGTEFQVFSLVRNGSEVEIPSVFSYAKWLRTEFRVFSLMRNGSERNLECFSLQRNGSERNSECFQFHVYKAKFRRNSRLFRLVPYSAE